MARSSGDGITVTDAGASSIDSATRDAASTESLPTSWRSSVVCALAFISTRRSTGLKPRSVTRTSCTPTGTARTVGVKPWVLPSISMTASRSSELTTSEPVSGSSSARSEVTAFAFTCTPRRVVRDPGFAKTSVCWPGVAGTSQGAEQTTGASSASMRMVAPSAPVTRTVPTTRVSFSVTVFSVPMRTSTGGDVASS